MVLHMYISCGTRYYPCIHACFVVHGTCMGDVGYVGESGAKYIYITQIQDSGRGTCWEGGGGEKEKSR